jgi:hypothetical protein
MWLTGTPTTIELGSTSPATTDQTNVNKFMVGYATTSLRMQLGFSMDFAEVLTKKHLFLLLPAAAIYIPHLFLFSQFVNRTRISFTMAEKLF